MKTELILIENDADHAEAMALVDLLVASESPSDRIRFRAQAKIIADYERHRWPTQPPSLPEFLTYLMDQHDLSRRDLIPILGSESRVSEIMNGKGHLTIGMIIRLQSRFRLSADLLLPWAKAPKSHRANVAA